MKNLLQAAILLLSFTAQADEMSAKLGAKAEKFLETLRKEVNIDELVEKRNATYSPTLSRSSKTPVADIGEKDEKWIAWKKNGGATTETFIKDVTEGKCAQVIQLLKARMSYITEVFVMDRLGANVCAFPATSDYDQGDEDKWIEPFNNGKSPFFGKISTDESTGENQGQVSLNVISGGKIIGVITIGIKSK